MGQVLDEVAGGVDVVAVPGVAVRVLGQRRTAAGDEVLGVAEVGAVDLGRRRRVRLATDR